MLYIMRCLLGLLVLFLACLFLQSYFMQKDAELASKQKAATAKKEKYLQGAGGLKFTALAMANRD